MTCKQCGKPIGASFVHDRDTDTFYHLPCALARFTGPLGRRVTIRARKGDLVPLQGVPRGVPVV